MTVIHSANPDAGAPGTCARRGTVRLCLTGTPDRGSAPTVGGAWWPGSNDLPLALPALLTELEHGEFRALRVLYHPLWWRMAPRRIAHAGRVVRLGWIRSIDPDLLILTAPRSRRLHLQVIRPDAEATVAGRALCAVPHPDGHGAPPTELLRVCGVLPTPRAPAAGTPTLPEAVAS